MEVGTGKTATCINTLRYKYEYHGRLLKTLVLAPPIVLENWRREFLLNSHIPDEDILVLNGSQKMRCNTLYDKTNAYNTPKIAITNYEALIMTDLFDHLKEFSPDVLVLDESHKCKDIKAKRTKQAIKLSDLAKYKYLLSGTPVLASLMDLWSQFRIMDAGETFGKNFHQFRNTYFRDANRNMPRDKYFPNWKLREEADIKMRELVARKSASVKKSECLDLPPLVQKTIYVEMTKAQAKLYEEMRKEFITFVGSGACVADLAITRALRLQQIVSGYIPVKEGIEKKNIKISDNPRAAALKELLEEIAPYHKVIIWAVFKENYKDIKEVCENLKLKYVEVHGDVSSAQKQKNVDEFNTDEETRVFIGHPGSGGIGINLVVSNYAIFYSRSFSLEYDIQAEGRNYRGGSEVHAKVTRIDLVTPNTIDEEILKALASKQEVGEKVIYKIAKEMQDGN